MVKRQFRKSKALQTKNNKTAQWLKQKELVVKHVYTGKLNLLHHIIYVTSALA